MGTATAPSPTRGRACSSCRRQRLGHPRDRRPRWSGHAHGLRRLGRAGTSGRARVGRARAASCLRSAEHAAHGHNDDALALDARRGRPAPWPSASSAGARRPFASARAGVRACSRRRSRTFSRRSGVSVVWTWATPIRRAERMSSSGTTRRRRGCSGRAADLATSFDLGSVPWVRSCPRLAGGSALGRGTGPGGRPRRAGGPRGARVAERRFRGAPDRVEGCGRAARVALRARAPIARGPGRVAARKRAAPDRGRGRGAGRPPRGADARAAGLLAHGPGAPPPCSVLRPGRAGRRRCRQLRSLGGRRVLRPIRRRLVAPGLRDQEQRLQQPRRDPRRPQRRVSRHQGPVPRHDEPRPGRVRDRGHGRYGHRPRRHIASGSPGPSP
jgi:hypothetical protein